MLNSFANLEAQEISQIEPSRFPQLLENRGCVPFNAEVDITRRSCPFETKLEHEASFYDHCLSHHLDDSGKKAVE